MLSMVLMEFPSLGKVTKKSKRKWGVKVWPRKQQKEKKINKLKKSIHIDVILCKKKRKVPVVSGGRGLGFLLKTCNVFI